MLPGPGESTSRISRDAGSQPVSRATSLELALGDVAGQPGEDRDRPAAPDLPPLEQLQAGEAVRRIDRHREPAPTGGIEPGALEGRLDPHPHPPEDRQEDPVQIVERGCPRVVGPARDRHPGGTAGVEERRQQGLEDQRGAPRRADVEPVVPGPDLGRNESDLARADLGALDAGAADLGRRLDGGQVLAHQPGPGPPRADVADVDRRAGDYREGEGGAEDLAAPLSHGTVEIEHGASVICSK